jgi:hypothetical protein
VGVTVSFDTEVHTAPLNHDTPEGSEGLPSELTVGDGGLMFAIDAMVESIDGCALVDPVEGLSLFACDFHVRLLD